MVRSLQSHRSYHRSVSCILLLSTSNPLLLFQRSFRLEKTIANSEGNRWSENQFKHVKFIKLDVDEVADVAQELGIRAMPTFIIFKNGEAVKEVVGANPKALQTFITEYAGEGSKEEI